MWITLDFSAPWTRSCGVAESDYEASLADQFILRGHRPVVTPIALVEVCDHDLAHGHHALGRLARDLRV